ncbi:MAG TPA: LL-diaminopimelate aminotransferase [Fibrobacteraceae bacterium]|nr:LL-diaminopimelate aminotransferase [Fibrobacteraceae bacterium]
MARINPHYPKLKAGYLFPEIGRRVRAYQAFHSDQKIIRMGIGDVVLPIPEAVRIAMHKAVDEMGTLSGFHGYGPEQGYNFLREAIAQEYKERGSQVNADEIFISDGSKCDTGNIQEIFAQDSRIALTDPVYPVYVDTNVMAGRTGELKDGCYAGIEYLPMHAGNGFVPPLPANAPEIIYLCSPNNPTGTVMSREELIKWVQYAKTHESIILFDAAYEAYIQDRSLPRSIFEIPGAREVAIEFRSFSKTAGFTGLRCGFTVIPKELMGTGPDGSKVLLQSLWNRRHTTKFNGVSYPVQRGAEAVFSPEGKEQIRSLVAYYMENARLLREGLQELGFDVYGGADSPYIWLRTPMDSWAFFDHLLNSIQVVGTPGAGFGPSGEGYFRLSAFALRESVHQALNRLSKLFPKR